MVAKEREENMAHPNEELFRKGYAAFQSGDMEALRELFAPDIVWHAGGRNPLSGDFKGVDEVLGNFMKTMERAGGTFKIELHDVMANDEHAVALASATGEREGKKLNSRLAHVAHIKDGKMTESWIHPDDQYAVDDFWA